MPYRLSEQAFEDLVSLTQYGVENFGLKAAEKYHLALTHTFELLADLPSIGRVAASVPGHRCFWHGRHVIYYREQGSEILISRLLHVAMDANRHLSDPQNE